MKQWLVIVGLLLMLLVAGFFVATNMIMPKAATAFVPVKWQNIPLGQNRNIVWEYLGSPDSTSGATDWWQHRLNDSKKYWLTVYYHDTVAKRYSIEYTVRLLGFHTCTEIRADSIP